MKTADFTLALLVDQSPEQVFKAVTNVRGWWSEEIEGPTTKADEEFKYHFEDIHNCQIKVTEVIPYKKVLWHVLDNHFRPGLFAEPSHPSSTADGFDSKEWIDTKISFEIAKKENGTELRFTHFGLIPEYACFEVCSNGWNHYIGKSLLALITTGKGQPNGKDTPMTKDEEKFRSTRPKSK